MATPSGPASFSIVITVYDEQDNVVPLLRDILRVSRPLGIPFEVIFVDDGSTDDTLARLRGMLDENPELVVLALRRNFGQTCALQAGFDRARGKVVISMDGDRQNDPEDVPRLLERIEEGADVVSGWRRDRQDGFVLRLLPSWFANRLIRWVTKVPIHDQGCSLKAYRREVVERLDLYSDMHRFVAVLTMPTGARIEEIEVKHHSRSAGESKYGLSRIFKVMADLFTIQMVTRFRESPLRGFAILGGPFFVGSVLTGLIAVSNPSSNVVVTVVSLELGMVFATCLFAGLLGQAIIDHSARSPRRALGVREHGDKI